MKRFFLLFFIATTLSNAQTGNEFINGVDISFLPQVEDNGGIFYTNGSAADPINIFQTNGVNYARLRLWHTPSSGYCDLQKTLEMAARIKEAGLKLLLDFHYSDTWADPTHQYKPAIWNNVGYEDLLDSVYNYTFNVIKSFDELNILPDMVQIGNEISPGFLWPEGRVGGEYDTPQQWTQFTSLLKRAISAVHDAASDSVKIMIHIDRGGNNSTSRWFFGNVISYGVEFDVIGQSYYPWWHGNLSGLSQNLNDLATRYGKEIIVAETAYPWTLQWYDNTNNLVGSSDQLHTGYPASVEGQYSFLYDLIQILKDVPDGKGIGLFYWAADWISTPTFGSSWENVALFDFQGNALNSMRVFKETEVDTSNAVNVTFRLNTSTNYDTLSSDAFVQLRGEVIGGADVLASGEELTWDINSDVVLHNVDGDYWETTVRIPSNVEIQYKYWTGHSSSKPTFLRLGWEGPIEPFDFSGGNIRKFIADDNDTTVYIEYYNSTGNTVEQYWSPFADKTDSVGVLFRVNVADIQQDGIFLPDIEELIAVRGDSASTNGVLSWSSNYPVLQPEVNSVADNSFWSGVAYFPKNEIGAGTEIRYKFGIIQSGGNFLAEDNERTFSFPQNDTTLSWVFFNDRNTVTGIEEPVDNQPGSFYLAQNYPNPFNPSTRIKYTVKAVETRHASSLQHVTIKVYDVLGNEVATLVNEEKSPGVYEVEFSAASSGNAEPQSLRSGVYFYQLKAGDFIQTKKMILLK